LKKARPKRVRGRRSIHPREDAKNKGSLHNGGENEGERTGPRDNARLESVPLLTSRSSEEKR